MRGAAHVGASHACARKFRQCQRLRQFGHDNGSVAMWLKMLSTPPRKRNCDAIFVYCEKGSTTLAQMRWQRLAPSWRARYVMKLARPGQPDRIVPWLNALTIGGHWGVGRTVCAHAKLPGAYAGFSIRTVGALRTVT
jgi:hypothetical protein